MHHVQIGRVGGVNRRCRRGSGRLLLLHHDHVAAPSGVLVGAVVVGCGVCVRVCSGFVSDRGRRLCACAWVVSEARA